ncbi:ABC transporter permease subunit [Rhizobium sp. S95]|uniref:ABC transporter permease subunit n=1 Tax=Ciceribacter sichuanensis TaxID=2949647 RepID=A0AAJ1FJB5_9HYPH|nr:MULTISPECIES: ABC transporter permease subunit [unclassified Ciceribacter]MCM2397047.1 ABC transporter permease subunit [Ciceribacter sp. S95]MCO5957861.1 ABC transporter permease subunit [Ciceribacter sp. S101]
MTILSEIRAEYAEVGTPARPPRRKPVVPLYVYSGLTVLAIIAIWWVAAALELVSPVFLPSPAVVAVSAWNLVTVGFVDSTLLEHVTASLGRILGALLVSILIGVPAGIAIGTSRIGRGILDPIVEFLRPLPPLAYLPLIIIWVGIGEASKITVIALSMLPAIILSTAAGVKSASSDHVNAARSFGATRGQLLRHVILPSALPSILTGIRIALGTGWSTLVAAELVAATRGLGFMIQSAAQFLVTDVVIAGIGVIALIAILLELVARALERWLVPWAGEK